MSLGDVLFLILFVLFCIDLIGSIVCMVLNYLNKKRELEYARNYIILKEHEYYDRSGEVKR